MESLRFCGVIERADYQQMLPWSDGEWWLCLILSVLVAICLLVLGPVSIFLAFDKGDFGSTLVALVFLSLMLVALWFLKGRILSHDRASRYLRMCPDVLGTAEGEFTEHGLIFHDGIRTYWFGARHLLRSRIRKDGIRVHVDSTVCRYLALSSRLFDGYSLIVAKRLKQHWKQLAKRPKFDSPTYQAECWIQHCQPPSDAIHFQGPATIEIPWRTPADRKRLLIEMGWLLVFATGLVIARSHLDPWMFGGGVSVVVCQVVFNAFQWYRYFLMSAKQQSWDQLGWISPTEFAIYSANFGERMPLSEIVQRTEYPEQVTFTTRSGRFFLVLRHMVANDEQWQRLNAIHRLP